MNGRLTVNRIRNCQDLKINMDDATIVGNYSSLDVNDVADSKKVDISMNRMKVMTTDQYLRSKAASGGGRPGGQGHSRHAYEGGQLTVNKVRGSEQTKISQEQMRIAGTFSDVRVNDISSSQGTTVNMGGFRLDDDSDSDSDDGYNGGQGQQAQAAADRAQAQSTTQNRSSSNTSGYYRTETVAFAVNLGRGANISLNYDPQSLMKDFKEFLGDKYNPIKGKSYRLHVVGTDPPRYVDEDPYKSLKDCGIVDRMDLRVVHMQPQSDS